MPIASDSKLRYDAALHFACSGLSPKRGPTPRLGKQVDVGKILDQYLKETQIEDDFETRTYQMQLLHKDIPDPLYEYDEKSMIRPFYSLILDEYERFIWLAFADCEIAFQVHRLNVTLTAV
jgi:hypothetical protein